MLWRAFTNYVDKKRARGTGNVNGKHIFTYPDQYRNSITNVNRE
jgi:hypothetical protein